MQKYVIEYIVLNLCILEEASVPKKSYFFHVFNMSSANFNTKTMTDCVVLNSCILKEASTPGGSILFMMCKKSNQ